MTEEELDQLSFRLFKTFARCEYALKAAGFRVGDHRRVDPDWTAFAQAIPNTFDPPNSEALTLALAYMQERPPLKQVLVDGDLDWSNAAPQAVNNTDLIFQYVRRVRQPVSRRQVQWAVDRAPAKPRAARTQSHHPGGCDQCPS